MLIMLVMNVEVLTLAPQYGTYGSQVYVVRCERCGSVRTYWLVSIRTRLFRRRVWSMRVPATAQ